MKRVLPFLLPVFFACMAEAVPWRPATLSDAQRARYSRPEKARSEYEKGDVCYVRHDCHVFAGKKYAERYAEALGPDERPVVVHSYNSRYGGGGGAGLDAEWQEDVVEEAKKAAVPIEKGTRITVYAASGKVVRFRKKKKDYFVAARDLMAEREWNHMEMLQEGEPATIGKARARRRTCACYTALMAQEYRQMAAVDEKTAHEWKLNNRYNAEYLYPGDEVIVMGIDESAGIAKIATQLGRVRYCNLADLARAR